MTTFTLSGRLFCVRRIADMSCPAWVAVHVLLYMALGVAALTSLGYLDGMAESLAGAVISMMYLMFFMPLTGVFGAIVVIFLLVLRPLGTLRWGWFRLAAVVAFALQGLLAGALMYEGEGAAGIVAIGAWHVVMGLLVVQPQGDRPHDLPSMDAHRF